MRIGRWQLKPLDGGAFSIDGGAAFGVVPKTVWQTIHPADDINRVRMTCNCLLAMDGEQVVLIDTGYGGKYPPMDRKAYGMQEGNPILEALARRSIRPEDVDFVLFTHLHFDHAGGATVRSADRQLVPTFPNARYLIDANEWEDAVSKTPELLAAYPQNNLEPLIRDEKVDLFDRDTELLPGLKSLRTGGHTRGHTAFLFESEDESEGALFLGDICPTRAHMKTLWNMSYDTFLLETRQKKRQFLERVAERGWWVFLPHDPFVYACRIQKHPAKEFTTTDLWERNESAEREIERRYDSNAMKNDKTDSAEQRRMDRFLGDLYWSHIQDRPGLKESFEDVYETEKAAPTFRRIYRDVFGDEFAEEADPCGFTTKSDLENIKKRLELGGDELLGDFACGRGGNGLYLARDLGARLKGIDLSENAVKIARKRVGHFGMEGRAEFSTGDLREMRYENHEFDAAICIDSLYMIPDKRSVLTELARVLKSNRVLAVLTWEMSIPLAVNDYRPLFETCGFHVDSYDEVPGWRERQKRVFEGILARRDTLIEEMGEAAASFWIHGAETELPKLDEMRRVLIVARPCLTK